MKVKSKTTIEPFITEGKEYNVINERVIKQYDIQQDNGIVGGVHQNHFTIIPDTPQIEVGSEWVNEDGDVYKIKYASDKTVVYGEDEVCVDTDYFLDMFKPKPKTVKLYFYTDCNGLTHAYSEPMPVFGDYKFTKEIEL